MRLLGAFFRKTTAPPRAAKPWRANGKMSRKRRIILYSIAVFIIAAVAINAPGIVSLAYYIRLTPLVNALPPVPPIKPTDRVLIVAPHPDDETLACGGLVQVALAAGAHVSAVYLTSGDGLEWDILLSRAPMPEPQKMLALGRRRMTEARNAAAALGIPSENLYFLGYPDAGLSHLISGNYASPYKSRHTGATAVPYPDAVSPGAAYTGRNLEKDLQSVITAVKPTIVLLPSIHEAHPDHRAAARFVTEALRGQQASLRRWMVHGGEEWPLPKGWHTGLPLEPPPRGKHLAWERLDLTPAQVSVKVTAIKCYRSQLELTRHFMEAFARKNELESPTDPPVHPEPRE
jgi:LmbE family N-acetylglucosaminyl deacetylase